jgi:hypothetical protein
MFLRDDWMNGKVYNVGIVGTGWVWGTYQGVSEESSQWSSSYFE